MSTLLDELHAIGASCSTPEWDDPSIDWAAFDAVVIRSAWDYPERPAAFLRWVRTVADRSALFNSPETVAWNLDKHYLRDVAEAGVPVVPTEFTPPGMTWHVPQGGEYVVKPAVSNAARHTCRFRPGLDDDRARLHVAGLHEAGRTVLTQPYQHAVDHSGELSLIYLDGQYSHAARKTALLQTAGPPADDLFFRSHITPDKPTQVELECAASVLEAVTARFGTPLYARIDLIEGPGGVPTVMECELVEPLLFFDQGPSAVQTLALAVLARLG
ncbi:hypothetical protein [Streptomyces axinellae]|uniref:ATP-grasp domain-containing protein n=1 Tax=Streptomyces axinellae TaxID=552788 RepID=UPI0031DC3C9D